MKILIDEVKQENKPNSNNIAEIQERLKDEKVIKDITIEELLTGIKKGYTIVPGVTIGGAKNENWKQQELVLIDIDNDNENNIITPEQAISMLKEKNIEAFGYYNTFSNTTEKPKFRIMLRLNEPIYDSGKMLFVINTLNNFLGGDKACKNLARLFFGTNGDKQKVVLLNSEATITFDNIVSLDNKLKEVKDYGNDLNKLVKEFDLLEYMAKDNKVSYKSNDRVNFETCSICGHKDCRSEEHTSELQSH